ncbi:Gp138 family membrane-puncturing spike protein [Entomohabitans teleogrylli]|uniref:Gp138 family membrane-puncturing spike protein n=1 Tax=Entomohabitans teleogrylli TaxID=1384589 RepID=UPI00073D5719|nr:Gp138 family membrane-puncturing spike protein [Entomohabitans teleogrylli]
MADTNLTDADPGQSATLAGVIEYVFKKMLQGIDGQLPAEIISYDRKTNRATVRPLITRITTTGERVERATVASVPVLALGGGDFGITFPLKAGDRGWIEASDRDISLFLQGNEISRPNTLRLHNFADGRFIPDLMADYDLPDGHDGALVIQHKSGESALLLCEKSLELRIGDVSVTATADGITLMVGGASLVLTASGLTHNGKNIGSTHTHPGVERGGSSTDQPE